MEARYLGRENGIFLFCLRIPEELQARFGGEKFIRKTSKRETLMWPPSRLPLSRLLMMLFGLH
ncbi:hypothetical protein AA309_05635 [Microvirga vignae]|uniref:Uncharacterized protein n=1 Tax=Microvirga vignae TaxID=1225564 RepID=A0A0H1RGJ3_9HYPH|nr:hypothetical protein AA309_05635 [Microvirga vignae]